MNDLVLHDNVVHENHVGTQVEWEGMEHLLTPDSEVLAKIVEVEEI